MDSEFELRKGESEYALSGLIDNSETVAIPWKESPLWFVRETVTMTLPRSSIICVNRLFQGAGNVLVDRSNGKWVVTFEISRIPTEVLEKLLATDDLTVLSPEFPRGKTFQYHIQPSEGDLDMSSNMSTGKSSAWVFARCAISLPPPPSLGPKNMEELPEATGKIFE